MEIISNNRFKDATWYSPSKRNVFIGGAGGIGSWLALFLSRANFRVSIADFDNFETHNLSGQLFMESDIGMNKTIAVNNVVRALCSDSNILPINTRITGDTDLGSNFYCFSAFDNMEARRILFEAWVERIENADQNTITPIFIDGRLEMEQLQIFCVTPDRIDQYRETLFNSSEIADAACTLKQTSHIAAMISSFMTGFFTNHLVNEKLEREINEVPFFFEYFLPQNLCTHEY